MKCAQFALFMTSESITLCQSNTEADLMTLPGSQIQMQFKVDVLILPFAHSSLFGSACSQWWKHGKYICSCSLYGRGKNRHCAMVLHLSSWVWRIWTGEILIITHLGSPIKFSTSSKDSQLLRDTALQQVSEDTFLPSGGCWRKSFHICVSIYVCDPNYHLLSSHVFIAICLDRLLGCQLIPIRSPELCRSKGKSAGAVGLPVTVSSPTVILRCHW